MSCGIYKILNKINNKYYIGSSDHIDRRWNDHKNKLRTGKHVNIYLQNAWNKYGEESFDFFILEEVEISKLLQIEQFYLDSCKEKKMMYNISVVAGSPMKGLKHKEEVKNLLSKKLSGPNHPHYNKQVDKEWRRNISKVKKKFTDEEETSFKKRYENGETKSSIAKDIGVHITTITRAIERSKKFDY